MLLQSPWIPRLANIEASPAERLALALADDIVEGRLAGGDRLPAHRDLAKRLRIGLGSVTQAYVSLERRGLTRSVQGRGTFVASRQAPGDAVIDLSSNAPPAALDARVLARTLAGIARSIDADHFNLYAPPGGHLEHRRALARWLETVGLPVEASHLVLTSGARQALSLAIELACGPRGVLLTERLTYPGALALARRQGCRVRGVEIDGEGMVPQSLAAALEATPGNGGPGGLPDPDPAQSDDRDDGRGAAAGHRRPLPPRGRMDHRRRRLFGGSAPSAAVGGPGAGPLPARQWHVQGARPGFADRRAGAARRLARCGAGTVARPASGAVRACLCRGAGMAGQWHDRRIAARLAA